MSSELSTRASRKITSFSTEDLSRVFDTATLRRGRSLILVDAVTVSVNGASIAVVIEHSGARHSASIIPSAQGQRVSFLSRCSCGQSACSHAAAGALAALDQFPALRRAEQTSFLHTLLEANQTDTGPPTAPMAKNSVKDQRQHLVFELSPGEHPHACFIDMLLIDEQTGATSTTTPARILADRTREESSRIMARMLGSGTHSRVAVAPDRVRTVLDLLPRLGNARWHANQRILVPGEERCFQANVPPKLPSGSAIIRGDAGQWYIDAATGAIGRVRQVAMPRTAISPRAFRPERQFANMPSFTGNRNVPRSSRYTRDIARQRNTVPEASAGPIILERSPVPLLNLHKIDFPDGAGHMQRLDALTISFDYDGIETPGDDERQFLPKAPSDSGGAPVFIRRDHAAEAAAFDMLRKEGLSQMRIATGSTAKGRMVFVYRGRDALERWQTFVADRVPTLVRLGWRDLIDHDFGPRLVESVGDYDVRIEDADSGEFSLDFGIEIDGKRLPLLPILSRLLERGGLDAAKIKDGLLVTSLEDGRILKLPAERIRRLLAVMEDLIDAARRSGENRLLLGRGEAAGVLDLEDLLTTRWDNAGAIEAYTQNFRGSCDIPSVAIPATFTATLRTYQQQGVDWLQHLRSLGLGGFLADDMGLGKTAQTIAHIVIEEAKGRLDRPALIVVPTSLVANWAAELGKFAPHLCVTILHGLDRHERRSELDGVHVVITTYTVLARDVEEMKQLSWHLVVLDEAQVIKSPDAKATRAVCQLETRHRVCLSGTPIENNLQELWSEFAFLNPGLLGDRRGFTKRFRTPIEKNNHATRRLQLMRRIKPFLLRRTKAEVATDLPPKHTILRRIDLAPDQRELYDTIRATLHDEVREKMADLTAAQGRIVVLDALLKLRQVCCDPHLVKLASARTVESSSKLDALLDMVTEMIPEGRRILLFSQFTSMLDLIKPRLTDAGVKFVELRGDTRDRAEPVRSFENGAVSLFLISLKAGGRGLNLTSADTVIHYDPWWNPAAEDQASDRAYRIGQTKPVFVYKMIAADTVEDRIVELQRRKADLAKIALSGDGDFTSAEVDDIEFLFGTGSEPKLPV